MVEQESRERFLRLLSPVHDQARGFARRICRSDHDGDDLFQETVLRALVKISDLRDEDKFRGWFFRVLVSLHYGRARRSFWRRLIPIDSAPAEAAFIGEDGSDWEDERFRAARARRALSALPADQRQAVVMLEIEGFSLQEIAEIQGASLTAVKTRVSRGRERLRKFYRSAGVVHIAALQGGTEG